MDSWINTTQSICTMKYYSATKRNAVLSHAITRVNLRHVKGNKLITTPLI